MTTMRNGHLSIEFDTNLRDLFDLQLWREVGDRVVSRIDID